MTLEFDKLTATLERMGESAQVRKNQQQHYLALLLDRLRVYANAWALIDSTLTHVSSNQPALRLARPLDQQEEMDWGMDLPACPPIATLIATDGSQILPDAHAPFLYYLINVGGFVYQHGTGEVPAQSTHPVLEFTDEKLFPNGQLIDGTAVGARRDLAEIETLAELAETWQTAPAPRLAVMDQRLLYWPSSSLAGSQERNEIVNRWLIAMSRIRDAQTFLAGYISRSRRNSVLQLLHLLDRFAAAPQLPSNVPPLTDMDLFYRLLPAGCRSCLFWDVSEDNQRYAKRSPADEICFFYLNVAATNESYPNIARVDLPRWIAADRAKVELIHALVYDQCQILGDYPYILTRADEAAVVGQRDQAELNAWIELKMDSYGIDAEMTAKQASKNLARAGKVRHKIY